MPIILATQEVEIRRIMVWSQPEQNSSRDPISKKKTHHKKKGWWSGWRYWPWVQPPELQKKKKTQPTNPTKLPDPTSPSIYIIYFCSLL
jgi:hypothetical protein